MDLSVIIVNYNVRDFLENALTSVQQALRAMDGEVIVVDNASDDGSVEMVRRKFPAVSVIAGERNVGFAAANNVALRRAKGRHFLLLNPDTVVQEDTFQVIVRFLDEHPDAGLAGCTILNPDGTLQPACRRSFPTPWVAFTKISGLSTLYPRSRVFGRYNLGYLDPGGTYEVDAISGSFMALRREVYEQVGGLDEEYFMYGEDLDWCFKIKQAGWKVYYVSETRIIHYKGESVRRSDLDEVRTFYRAMRIFVDKHHGRGAMNGLILRAGISVREWIAFLVKVARPMRAGAIDLVADGRGVAGGGVPLVRRGLQVPRVRVPDHAARPVDGGRGRDVLDGGVYGPGNIPSRSSRGRSSPGMSSSPPSHFSSRTTPSAGWWC